MATFFLFGITSIQSSGEREKPPGFAQADRGCGFPSQTRQLPPKGRAPQKPDKKPNATSLYRKHYQKCHDQDGIGTDGRETFPEIPDFTSEKWQKGRSEAELVSSILDGKGKSMPQFANKFNKEEAKALAAFVRSFGPSEIKPMAAIENDFERQFQELFEQMKEWRQHFRELSKTPGKAVTLEIPELSGAAFYLRRSWAGTDVSQDRPFLPPMNLLAGFLEQN